MPDKPSNQHNLNSAKTYDKVVVFRSGQFGDTLVALPAIAALKLTFPTIPLIVLTNRFKTKDHVEASSVLSLLKSIDRIVTYAVEDGFLGRRAEIAAEIGTLDKALFVYLQYPKATRAVVLRDYLFFKLLGMRTSWGFKEAWAWAKLYKHANVLPFEGIRLNQTLANHGVHVYTTEFQKLLQNQHFTTDPSKDPALGGPLLVLSPVSKMQAKCWPIQRFSEVAQFWINNFSGSVVIIGGTADARAIETLVDTLPSNRCAALCG